MAHDIGREAASQIAAKHIQHDGYKHDPDTCPEPPVFMRTSPVRNGLILNEVPIMVFIHYGVPFRTA
jgi:hypothetical protein